MFLSLPKRTDGLCLRATRLVATYLPEGYWRRQRWAKRPRRSSTMPGSPLTFQLACSRSGWLTDGFPK